MPPIEPIAGACSACGRENRNGDLLILPSGFCRVCDVVNTARKLLSPGHLFCFDCETTGLGMEHEIIRVAVVGQAGLTFHSYVKPRTPIDEASQACQINGIKNSDVENAFSFSEVYDVLCKILYYEAVVAFNVTFDKGQLDANADRVGSDLFSARWHCVSELFAQFVGTPGRLPGQYQFHSLKTACERLGVMNEIPHHPLSDCYATLGVLKALAEYEVKT